MQWNRNTRRDNHNIQHTRVPWKATKDHQTKERKEKKKDTITISMDPKERKVPF